MYKYQPWSSGNEDCFSWSTKTSKTNYNFAEIYGAKPSKYFNDYFDTSWYYKDYLKIGPTKKNRCKGEDDYMTQIRINIMGGKETDYARAVEESFSINAPKFKVGDKIKFYIKDFNWKQGVVYTVSKQVNISSTQNDKNFKIDNVQWHYVIIESGTLKTHNGVREDHVKIDDTPDYNKYFKMLGAYGLNFKESDFTIIYWEQAPIFNSWGIVTGYNTNVTLKPKFNDHKTNLSFWTNDANKLPTISEKC